MSERKKRLSKVQIATHKEINNNKKSNNKILEHHKVKEYHKQSQSISKNQLDNVHLEHPQSNSLNSLNVDT